MKRDRAQLWAESVALFHAGESWWLEQKDEGAAAAVLSMGAADDPWTADVLRVVEGLTETSTREVFQMLAIPLDEQTKSDAMRIAGILMRANWSREGKFTAGPNRGLSRYVAPSGGQHD